MISFTSSTSVFGPNVVVNPKSASFRSVRPATISASASASCASTVERPGSHIASSTSSLYDVLGIRMEATCQEIKTAYRRLARVVHPDVVAAAGKGKASADEFLKIHEAYSTLSDPYKRADYDRRLFERQWHANNSRFAMSSSYGSRYSSYNRPRKWETDQCW